MIDQALRCTLKNPVYAYIAPTYGAAKRIAWQYLKDYTKDIPDVEPNEAELKITLHRPALKDKIVITLLGAENPNSLRGIYLDGVVLDEYAVMNPDVFTHVVRPALSDRRGWAIFISTPSGTNHFYEMYQYAKNKDDWFRALYRADETGLVPASELEAAKQLMGDSVYEQEFLCSFSAALVGAYYGKEMEVLENTGRIAKVPYDAAVPVVTAWDLGISDTTCIWFVQLVGKSIHVIDYLENSGSGLDYYVKELTSRPYNYSEHILPHDAEARDLSTGKTRTETLKTMGLKNISIAAKLSVEDGINASRLLLQKTWMDAEKCKRGIDALKNYERKWDSKNQIYQARPLHNWASHGADAWRTLAVGLDENRPDEQALSRLPRQTSSSYNIWEA